jgi:hypothetical protein
MSSSGILHLVALVETEVSEGRSASIIRVTGVVELGKTLAVTSNRRKLRQEPHGMTSQKTSVSWSPLWNPQILYVVEAVIRRVPNLEYRDRFIFRACGIYGVHSVQDRRCRLQIAFPQTAPHLWYLRYSAVTMKYDVIWRMSSSSLSFSIPSFSLSIVHYVFLLSSFFLSLILSFFFLSFFCSLFIYLLISSFSILSFFHFSLFLYSFFLSFILCFFVSSSIFLSLSSFSLCFYLSFFLLPSFFLTSIIFPLFNPLRPSSRSLPVVPPYIYDLFLYKSTRCHDPIWPRNPQRLRSASFH